MFLTIHGKRMTCGGLSTRTITCSTSSCRAAAKGQSGRPQRRGGGHCIRNVPSADWRPYHPQQLDNAHYVATPFSLRIRHTFSDLMGMSTWVTPRWARASTTALTMAGGAAMVGDSPMPLAPNGLWGLGVTIRSRVNRGNAAAEGMA